MLHWPYKMLNVRHGHESRLWFDSAQPSVLQDDFERFSFWVYNAQWSQTRSNLVSDCILLLHGRSFCSPEAKEIWLLAMDQYHNIFGYSDNNWILAPSLGVLEDMLQTCEKYAATHNLKFSTDPNPSKWKPNNLLFWKDPEPYPIFLWRGNPLPWVEKLKQTNANVIDGCQLDMEVKNARYIEKNSSLRQEQYFAHPQCKFMINNIYNSHYTGSQLWLLNSKEMDKMEGSYNKSIKVMFNLPWSTHRKLLDPLTGAALHT